MSANAVEVLQYRRALEALRNGVPNRDAVSVMGCAQAEIEQRFRQNLELTQESLEKDKQAPGMLVTGDFGSGKSHLLEYLQHLALSENFVCSKVVISKETPLSDPAKVFNAAIEAAQVPGLSGPAIQEMASRFRPDTPEYANFRHWCERRAEVISPLFIATLLLHERLGGDPEMVEKIVGFWSGERLASGPHPAQPETGRIGFPLPGQKCAVARTCAAWICLHSPAHPRGRLPRMGAAA